MADRCNGGSVAVPAAATKVTTLAGTVGIPGGLPLQVRALTIRNSAGALNPLYIGGSGVVVGPNANTWFELDKGQEHTFGGVEATGPIINTDTIFVIGTANAANNIYITWVV